MWTREISRRQKALSECTGEEGNSNLSRGTRVLPYLDSDYSLGNEISLNRSSIWSWFQERGSWKKASCGENFNAGQKGERSFRVGRSSSAGFSSEGGGGRAEICAREKASVWGYNIARDADGGEKTWNWVPLGGARRS